MLKTLILAGTALAALTSASFADQAPRPMFKRGVGMRPNIMQPTALPTWTFSYTYQSKTYKDIFVGTDPSGGASTTVPVYIFPIKLKVGTFTADPLAKDSNGKTVVDYTVGSPLFDATTDYNQGGTDLGATQYIDAFQRANLWGTVSSHPGYHVLLGTPTIEKEVSIKVPSNYGTTGSPFGIKVAEVNLAYLDTKFNALLKKKKIPANSLPIFLITQTYETSGGCCIGGYHNYTGTQAYSVSTYITNPGKTVTFAQDVSALSHEIGEWQDDPLINNSNTPSTCGQNGNSLYEVGDPLEGTTNYGNYVYTLNGFSYHLQDLVTPPYFGAPASTSIPFNQSFQGHKFSVCQNGG